MKKTYLISVILVLTMCAAAIITASGNISLFIDFPSMVMVIGITCIMIIFNWDIQTIIKSFKAPFKQNPLKKELEIALVFFNSIQKYLIYSSILGLLSGVMVMLGILNDSVSFGRGLAIALLVIYYNFIIQLILVTPFKSGIKKKLIETD